MILKKRFCNRKGGALLFSGDASFFMAESAFGVTCPQVRDVSCGSEATQHTHVWKVIGAWWNVHLHEIFSTETRQYIACLLRSTSMVHKNPWIMHWNMPTLLVQDSLIMEKASVIVIANIYHPSHLLLCSVLSWIWMKTVQQVISDGHMWSKLHPCKFMYKFISWT